MAFYSYYQQAQPGWGQQYSNGYNQQFMAPPAPQYTPQPSWTGQDYYRAHYSLGNNGMMDSTDIGLFDWVWSRLKDFVGRGGVGREEARMWHSRVYGGQVDITSLLPTDLGAAAGYEAMRLFKYHKSIYRQPLMDDREREEEALAGLAIAEGTKLWSYCQRPTDKYGRRETCEVAAATAERLFRRSRRDRSRDYDDYEVSSSYGSRRGSGGYSSSSEDYEDDRRHKHRRRRSSASYGQRMISGGSPYMGTTPLAIPSYGGVSAYPSTSSAYGQPQPMYAAQPVAYAQQPVYQTGVAPGYGYGGVAPMTSGAVGGLVVPQGRTRHGSFSYPGGAPVYPSY